MIIEYIKSKKRNNQGRIGRLINYIFGKTKHNRKSSKHDLTDEIVEFIGFSNSILMNNPLLSFENGRLKKLNGKEANLEPIIERFIKAENRNKRVKHPIEHIIVSLQKGEKLNSIQWLHLAKELTNKLGFNDHHWTAVIHKSTKNQHLHLACCAVSNSPPYRRLVLSNSYKKTALIRNELEIKFGLKHDHNPYTDGHGKQVNNAKYKTKIQSVRTAIDTILNRNEKISLPEFIENLSKKGIGCYAQTRRDIVRGLSFTLGTFKVTGSKLGIGYNWKALQERGVYYDSSRHQSSIERSNNFEKELTKEIDKFSLPKPIYPVPNHLFIKNIRLKVSQSRIRAAHYSEKGASVWGIWIKIPLSFRGKTKEQIESDINFQKMLRIILTIYFNWLRSKEEEKRLAWEQLKPFLKKLKPPTELVSENTLTCKVP